MKFPPNPESVTSARSSDRGDANHGQTSSRPSSARTSQTSLLRAANAEASPCAEEQATSPVGTEPPPPYTIGEGFHAKQADKISRKADHGEQRVRSAAAGPSRTPWSPVPPAFSDRLQSFLPAFSLGSTTEKVLAEGQVKKLNNDLAILAQSEDKAAFNLLDEYIDEICSAHQLNRWTLTTDLFRQQRASALGNEARSALFRGDDVNAAKALGTARQIVDTMTQKCELTSLIGADHAAALICLRNSCPKSLAILFPETVPSSAMKLKSAVVSQFRDAVMARNATAIVEAETDIWLLVDQRRYWQHPGKSFASTDLADNLSLTSKQACDLIFTAISGHGGWYRDWDREILRISRKHSALRAEGWVHNFAFCGLSLENIFSEFSQGFLRAETCLDFTSLKRPQTQRTKAFEGNLTKTLLLSSSLLGYRDLTKSGDDDRGWISAANLQEIKDALLDPQTQAAMNAFIQHELLEIPSSKGVAINLLLNASTRNLLDNAVVELIQS